MVASTTKNRLGGSQSDPEDGERIAETSNQEKVCEMYASKPHFEQRMIDLQGGMT